MNTVTSNNKYETTFANFNSILTTNTNSYKVVRSFSYNSDIPIITVNISFDPDGNATLGIATIRCFTTSVSARDTLGQEIENLLKSNIDTFENYNMSFSERNINSFNGEFDRGNNKYIKYKEISVTFVIK